MPAAPSTVWSGINMVLALTIALDFGDIARFQTPGDFASCARAVNSRRESNGKTKGDQVSLFSEN